MKKEVRSQHDYLKEKKQAKVGVKVFTPGNWTNFFPLRRDKKEDT
jgi:hypothetical protein